MRETNSSDRKGNKKDKIRGQLMGTERRDAVEETTRNNNNA